MKNKLLLIFIPFFSWFTIADSNNIPKGPRISSHPFISGDTFRSFCDFIIDETNIKFDAKALQDGDTIFLKTDLFEYFFKSVHPYIKKKYILVTHNSDFSVPGKFASYLRDDKLIAWFGQNVSECLPKLIPIPIGIANRYWPHGNTTIFASVIDNLPKQKNKLLYLNIATSTHPERQLVEQLFSSKPFCFRSGRKPFKPYLEDLANSSFVLSPRGNGIDCHRTWEALLCGSFPIVRHSSIDELFAELPVVIINDWKEVTEEFLHDKLKNFSLQKFNMKKLYADYWLDLIRDVQRQYRR